MQCSSWHHWLEGTKSLPCSFIHRDIGQMTETKPSKTKSETRGNFPGYGGNAYNFTQSKVTSVRCIKCIAVFFFVNKIGNAISFLKELNYFLFKCVSFSNTTAFRNFKQKQQQKKNYCICCDFLLFIISLTFFYNGYYF